MVKKKILTDVIREERLRGTKTSIAKEKNLFRLYPEIQWQFLRKNPDYIKDYLDYEQKKESRKASFDISKNADFNDADTLLEHSEIADFEKAEFEKLEERYAFKWSLKKLVHYNQEKLNSNNEESFIEKSFMEMVSYAQLENREDYLIRLQDGTYEHSSFPQILDNHSRFMESEEPERSKYLLICLDLKETNYKQAKVLVSKFIEDNFEKVNKDKKIGSFTSIRSSIDNYLDVYEHMIELIKMNAKKSDGEFSMQDLKNYIKPKVKIGNTTFNKLADAEAKNLLLKDGGSVVQAFTQALKYIDLAPNIPFADNSKKHKAK